MNLAELKNIMALHCAEYKKIIGDAKNNFFNKRKRFEGFFRQDVSDGVRETSEPVELDARESLEEIRIAFSNYLNAKAAQYQAEQLAVVPILLPDGERLEVPYPLLVELEERVESDIRQLLERVPAIPGSGKAWASKGSYFEENNWKKKPNNIRIKQRHGGISPKRKEELRKRLNKLRLALKTSMNEALRTPVEDVDIASKIINYLLKD